jgi:hypothetical protein
LPLWRYVNPVRQRCLFHADPTNSQRIGRERLFPRSTPPILTGGHRFPFFSTLSSDACIRIRQIANSHVTRSHLRLPMHIDVFGKSSPYSLRRIRISIPLFLRVLRSFYLDHVPQNEW